MSDFFTKDEKNLWGNVDEETVDTTVDTFQCDPGYERNSEGNCVKIAKTTSTTPGAVVEEEKALDGVSSSEKRSWESLDSLEKSMYKNIVAKPEKIKQQVLEFDKTYTPSKDLGFEIGFKDEGEESELVKDKSSKLFSYLIKNNTRLQEELAPEAVQVILPEVKEQRDEIFQKYDLSNADEAVKAQQEFDVYFNEKLEEQLSKSSEYLGIMNDIKETTGQAAASQFRNLQRQALGYEGSEKDIGAFGNIGENLDQFGRTLNENFQSILSGVKGSANSQNVKNLNEIKARLDSGEIKLTDDVSRVIGEGTRAASMQTKTAEEWLNEYTELQEGSEESLSKTLDYLNKLEWKSQWTKANEFTDEDGMTANDLVGSITQNVLQIPLAMLTYGVSAAMQEGGGGYRANLKAIARKEFDIPEGEEPTNDQLMRIMNENKDKKGLAVMQGLAGGALEYIGVKKSVAALLLGKKAFGSLIRLEGAKALRGGGQTVLAAGQSGFFEAITETGQGIIGQAGETYSGGKNVFDAGELYESALQGLAVGTFLPIAGGAVRQGMLEYRTTVAKISAKYGSDQNSEKFYKEMQDAVMKSDFLTEQEKREKINLIGDARNAHMQLPNNMTNAKDKEEAILALMEIQALNKQYKGVAKELIPEPVKAQINNRKEELTKLAYKNQLIKISKEDTKLMEAFANGIDGLNSETYETTKQAQAAWNLMIDEKAAAGLIESLDGLNEQDRADVINKIKKGFTNANGNILVLKDGSQEIILDNESKTNADGTVKNALAANHELLHAVLTKVIGNNPQVFENLYKELNSYLAQQVKAGKMSSVVFNRINQRFDKAYKGKKQFDEFMTVISEEMQLFKVTKEIDGKGDGIDISDSILQNIINIITKAFRALTGKPIPSSLKFETGKDVFDFIKSYNKVYNKGGKARSAFIKEINAIKEEDRIATQQKIAPESFDKRFKKPTRKQTEKAQESKQSLFEETGNILKEYGKTDTAGLLIGLEWENEIKSRIKNGIRIPGTKDFVNFYTLENSKGERIITDEGLRDIIKGFSQGNRGIKGLVSTYDKNKNDSLSAWINTFFNERLLEYIPDDLLMAAQRVEDLLIEPIDESVVLGENTDKVRPMKSFSDFSIVKDEVVKQAKDEVITAIQELYANEQDIISEGPERILEVIQTIIETKARNIVKASMGTISQVDGKTVISPEYLNFIEQSYKGAIAAYSLETIKRKFTRSTPKLFEVTKIPGKKGQEKVKKVNPDTGKTTYFVKGIFRIKAPSRAAWTSFHTSSKFNYTTLRERQNSYATEVTAEIAQQGISEFASNPKNLIQLTPDSDINTAVGVKTVLDNIANEIDKKSNEQKSFDSFRSSTKEIRNLPIQVQEQVGSILRSTQAIEYLNLAEGNMDWFINNLFAGTNLLNDSQIKKIAEELQPIHDKVAGKKVVKKLDGFKLNEFIANKMQETIEVNAYGSIMEAAGYPDVKFSYNSKDDLINARVALNTIAKQLGREQFLLYYAPGFTSASKISRGGWVANGLRDIKFIGLKENSNNDQRYGVIENVADLNNNILEGVPKKGEEGYISMPDALVYENPGITLKPSKKVKKSSIKGKAKFSDWVFKPPKGVMYTDEQIEAIQEVGIKSKIAYDLLIKKLREIGPKGSGIISPSQMLFLFKAMNSQTNAIARTAAELGKLPDIPNQLEEVMVLEHIIQAVTMNVIALDHVFSENPSDAFDLTLKDYETTYLPESYDTIINSTYKQHMPFYWEPGITGMVRYYNAETSNEFMLNLIDIRKGSPTYGKIYGEDFANTISYEKAKPYIKGKAFIIEQFNSVVSNVLDPNSSEQTVKVEKVKLNKVVEFYQEIGVAVQENVKNLESSGDFRSSIRETGKEPTIDQTINEAKRLDALVEQNRKDFFEENYPFRSSVRETISDQFNQIIEENTGIGAEKVFSRARAMSQGRDKGRWAFIMDPSAEDFKGLIYNFIGKGKEGDKQLKFFNETLFRPFAQAMASIDKARQALSNDYRALLKQYPNVKEVLNKDSGYGNFTIDSAIRVYLFNKAGFEIPGLSQRDLDALNKIVESNPEYVAFAESLSKITKQDKAYIQPGEFWLTGSIPADLEDITKRIGRKKYLKTWIENKNEIFSKDNLNKIEALHGNDFREALEDILMRMETGSNRLQGGPKNKVANNFMNWVNNSVGAIMFFNARSAVLQTISAFNYINQTDNNIIAAGKAFANTEQYWADFVFLFNSDFLKQRRSGLQGDINAAELATAVANKRNKAKAALNYLLTKGFLPTQIADSFAIASGGATFYRNRINTLMKGGMTKLEAEAETLLQWRELSEEAQQSSRPDKISQQQAGPLGRVILAFANTPMQYTRLQKRAIQDLINGRGDWKTNMSKVLYYGFIQNLIFNALQAALFAVLFDDDEELDPKGGRIANGMADSLLRGLGIYGAAVAAGKNVVLEAIRQSKKSRPDFQNAALQALSISPPISSKINKLRSAAKTWQYNKDDIMREGLSLENPAYLAVSKIISATTNIPLDRLFMKIDNLKTAAEKDTEMWQSIALALGWDQWSLGLNPYDIRGSKKPKKRKASKSKSKSKSKKSKRK